MSAPRSFAASCNGKAAYRTFAQAKRGASRLGPRGDAGSIFQAYRCAFCGAWHVGEKLKTRDNAKYRKARKAERRAVRAVLKKEM